MRQQFLYLDKAGFYYNAPGNINIGAGSKGTVFFWYHPASWNAGDQPVWEAQFDATNYLRCGFTGGSLFSFVCRSNNVQYAVHWENFFIQDYQKWVPIACTWDFTTPGAGEMRLYINGQEAPMQVHNAEAPLGEALRLYLGARPGTASAGLDGYLDNVAVWDGAMTSAQYQALMMGATTYGERQAARRRRLQESDGTGVLTFLATFDGTFDAEIAGGDPQAQWLVEASDYHHFARIDDGTRGRGQRHAFRFGIPRHDDSDDDRVPVRAVLGLVRAQGADQYTTLVDRETYSEINVSQLKPIGGVGQGVGWIRPAIDPNDVPHPATVRMRVNLPDSANPKNTKICLGPLTYISGGMHGNNFATWGTGESFTVMADGGNSASSFKTNLSVRSDGYWQGAEISLQTGTGAGCRLKVTGYTASTGVVTLAGALPATPAAGDVGVVNFRGRLVPTGNPCNETYNLEAWLWEEYGEDRPWIELEAVYGTGTDFAAARYQRGRTAWMELTSQHGDGQGRDLMFGRNGWEQPASFSCNILIESLIIEAPGSYQVMSPEDTRGRRGFELADTFLLRDMGTGHSCRVWRAENCGWASAAPTLNPDPSAAIADLQAIGTWRDQAFFRSMVRASDDVDAVIAAVVGTGAEGTRRVGYVRGTWNTGTNRITWQDETPPAGKSNPFLATSALRPWEASDSTWGLNGNPGLTRIFQTPDERWAMLVLGNEDNPDHYYARAYHGAPDRWSFDVAKHWWPSNPVLPGNGGVDVLPPMVGGSNYFGNRDAEWITMENPFARDPGRRFAAYARFKTILPLSGQIGANRRPVAGWTSPDLKSFFLLPHGTSLSPLGIGQGYTMFPWAASDDFIAMAVETLGGVTRLWASDDDRHFQQVIYSFLPDCNPMESFRLGDRRIYYYATSGTVFNLAYQGYNRETYYQLNSGQLSGMIETAVLMKPASGWGNLIVNVAPAQGTVQVAVLDATTGEAIAGYGAEDCTALNDSVERPVTWGTVALSELTAEAVRLRFYLSRTSTGETSPKLFSWLIGQPQAATRPSATALQVEGKANPAGIMDATPTLSWSYADEKGLAQSAYQVLVASSQVKLDTNEGDLWDTGVIAGEETAVV
ncbi:MAG: LamG domain-containing protein, partial [Armatimonadetes bacterium]|nr:LamG domain-containing protein [Armatimonadota bacterium]